MSARPALTRDRIVEAAVTVADRGGLGAVSMRSVGREVGAEAMSLYHHLCGKEELLDALADWAFSRIRLPRPDQRHLHLPQRSAVVRLQSREP